MTKKNISGWNAVTPGKTEKRKQGREEGQKKGREEGRIEEKSALIRKKLEKGKTISEIADDLEDTEENIGRLIEQFHLEIPQ